MLTILLSTFNRPQYLSRLLNYFAGLGVTHPICVSDASAPECFQQNRALIDSLGGSLTIRHMVWDSSLDQYVVLLRCLERIETKYVVWVHDDDFVVPAALDEALAVMERDASYVAVQGKQVAFTSASHDAHAESLQIAPLNFADFSVEAPTAAARVQQRLSQDTLRGAPKTEYAVRRTDAMLRIHREVFALGLDLGTAEFALNQMVMLAGNIKLLDRLHLARQHHTSNANLKAHVRYVPIVSQSSTGESFEPLVDTRVEEKLSRRFDVIESAVDPLFPIKFDRMVTCLAHELSRQDGLSPQESRDIVKDWQMQFLARKVAARLYQRTGYLPARAKSSASSRIRHLRQWARGHIPGADAAYRKLLLVYNGQTSLAGSVNPRSGFNRDLEPICRAVTVPPAMRASV